MSELPLKPCANCGRKALLDAKSGRSKIGTPYFRGRAYCKCGMNTGFQKSREKLLSIWNTRTTDQTIKDLQEENKIYAGNLDAAIEDYNKEKSKVDTLTGALEKISKTGVISVGKNTPKVVAEQALEKVRK